MLRASHNNNSLSMNKAAAPRNLPAGRQVFVEINL